MKKHPVHASRYALPTILLTAAILLAAPVRADYTATADPTIQYQTFQGWGTSLAWWAKVVGGYPEPARQDYMDKAFDPVKGLGLNVVRYNIGGGENPQYLAPNKQFLQYRAAVPGYEPSPGQWDWSADAGQRWVLQKAIKMGANQLEAFSNSPPYWMTVSGSVTGNHDRKDNLKPDSDTVFADYLAEVVKHFHDAWGVTFRSLEPLNEPSGGWSFGNWQEGCHVDRAHQNLVVKATGAALAKRGLKTRASASDESVVDDAARTFPLYDADSLKYLAKINTHSYGGNARTQVATFAASAGKDLWLSEYGDNDASGLSMSRRILEDMNGLHPTAWVYWQVVDSSSGWGFLRNPQTDATNTAYTINKKYYVMGQYSKFIRPGYRFYAITDKNSLAAYDSLSRTVVIVTTNSSDETANVTYDLSRFTQVGSSVTACRTSPTEDLAKLPPLTIARKQFVAALPAKSVTTFVISSTAYTGSPGLSPNDWYEIVNAQSGLMLQEQGSSLFDFTPVVLGKETAKGDTQQWRLLGQGNGIYKLINRHNGALLEVGGAKPDSGASVDLYQDKYDPSADSNQQWKLQRAANGSVVFLNMHSNLALNAAGTTAGTFLEQRGTGSEAGQQWRLRRVVLPGEK